MSRRWLRGNGYLFLLWLRRDLRARYAGSLAGTLWAALLPLLTVGLFYVIFALVLQVRIPALAGDSGYFFYLLDDSGLHSYDLAEQVCRFAVRNPGRDFGIVSMDYQWRL